MKKEKHSEMKRFFIISFFFVLAVCLCNSALATTRSDKLKPKWLTQAVPESKSGTYTFVIGHGEGVTLEGARQVAFAMMAQKLENERGLTINSNLQIQERIIQNNTSTNTEYRQDIVLDVIEKGHQLKIVCREIDEYWVFKNNKYQIDILYTVADKGKYGGSYDDQIIVTTKYPGAGFLSVVPGVGQMYKGSVAKGVAIIGAEVLAAGGILLCENTRASYIKKMQEQPKYAAEYNSRADTWTTGRNVCIGAAAAIYAYNLIDAFVATGAKHVVVRNAKYQLSAVPMVDNQSIGVCLALRF